MLDGRQECGSQDLNYESLSTQPTASPFPPWPLSLCLGFGHQLLVLPGLAAFGVGWDTSYQEEQCILIANYYVCQCSKSLGSAS